MDVKLNLPPSISDPLNRGLVKKLPRTFQPYINQEIQSWQFKFPYEQNYLQSVISYLDGLSPEQFENLFLGVRQVEAKMDLGSPAFSEREQTIEAASILARSPYYLPWREEVNKVFDRIHGAALGEEQARLAAINRLLLLVFPGALPLDPHDLLPNWPDGQLKRLDWPKETRAQPSLLEALLKGKRQPDGRLGPGFLEEFAATQDRNLGDVWLIESGTGLRELLPGLVGVGQSRAILLSFERLKAFREAFLEQIKSMRKSLADADAISHRLRGLKVESWCPEEIGNNPVIREFVRALFLSNNGTQLFSNAFVEWGTAQAAAHARPVVVVCEFGLRSKPKPFTSVAIFENPASASPLPSVPDPEGSAVDAGMLAYYAWLEMRRHPECRRTACVCLFENAPYVFAAGTEDFPLWKETEPVAPERLASILRSWLI
jgi:hypothetical protein